MKKLLLLIPFIIISCGYRKVDTSKTDKEIKTDISEISEVNLTYETDKFTLEPFDPDRAILINGSKYENTRIVIEKENGLETTKTTKEDKTEVKEETKEKHTERDNTKLFVILGIGAFIFLFFVVLCVFAYVYMQISSFKKVLP